MSIRLAMEGAKVAEDMIIGKIRFSQMKWNYIHCPREVMREALLRNVKNATRSDVNRGKVVESMVDGDVRNFIGVLTDGWRCFGFHPQNVSS